MDSPTDTLPEFNSFGEALRAYRENIADRIRRFMPGGLLPELELSAKKVVALMNASGYEISAAAYSDIEQGRYLPKDPGAFLAAVAPCLALEKGSPDYTNLMDYLVIELLKQRMGAEATPYIEDIRALRRGKHAASGRAEREPFPA